MSLAKLGMSDDAERMYLALLNGRAYSAGSLAEILGLDEREVGRAAAELAEMGLVSRRGDHESELVLLPPGATLDALAERRSREATAARVAAVELSELWRATTKDDPLVEVLTSTETMLGLSEKLIVDSSRQVRALSLGPTGEPQLTPKVAWGAYSTLDRGVPVRAVYSAEILRNPAGLAAVTECIELGEQARVYPTVPFNLLIGDSFAMQVFGGVRERVQGIIAYHGDLYSRLEILFEMMWDLALPISPTNVPMDDSAIRDAHRELFVCLASGLTDDSIASRLGVSQRTVARRIAMLQEHLGTGSRFQLGVQASRRGWL